MVWQWKPCLKEGVHPLGSAWSRSGSEIVLFLDRIFRVWRKVVWVRDHHKSGRGWKLIGITSFRTNPLPFPWASSSFGSSTLKHCATVAQLQRLVALLGRRTWRLGRGQHRKLDHQPQRGLAAQKTVTLSRNRHCIVAVLSFLQTRKRYILIHREQKYSAPHLSLSQLAAASQTFYFLHTHTSLHQKRSLPAGEDALRAKWPWKVCKWSSVIYTYKQKLYHMYV